MLVFAGNYKRLVIVACDNVVVSMAVEYYKARRAVVNHAFDFCPVCPLALEVQNFDSSFPG